MSLAQRIAVDTTDLDANDEAKERVNSALYRDLSFRVRGLIGKKFSDGDVDTVVQAVLQISQSHERLTKATVVKQLRLLDRSPSKAEELATAMGL